MDKQQLQKTSELIDSLGEATAMQLELTRGILTSLEQYSNFLRAELKEFEDD